ncbi:zinc finger protein zas1 [Rhypophila decipiens]
MNMAPEPSSYFAHDNAQINTLDHTPWSASAPASLHQTPVPIQTQTPSTSTSSVKRFVCTAPGCNRHFTRKEHLTRHTKSHSAQLQHQCPICRRRYARSDVLKRHIEFHPQNSGTGRRLVACTTCHERRLKCDEKTPCQSCARNNLDCVRSGPTSSWEVSPSNSTAVPDGPPGSEHAEDDGLADVDVSRAHVNHNGDAGNHETDPSMLVDIRDSDMELIDSSTWSGPTDPHHPWAQVQQSHYEWSLPSLPSLPSGAPSVVQDAPDFTQWPMFKEGDGQSPSSRTWQFGDHGMGLAPASASNVWPAATNPHHLLRPTTTEDAPLMSETATGPSMSDKTPSTSRYGTDRPFEAASPNSTHSPITPMSQGDEYDSSGHDLHSLLSRNPKVTRDLVQVFFAQVHPYWPILHISTFKTKSADKLLLGSMIMLSSWAVGRTEHLELAPQVFDEIMMITGPESIPSLHSLQALLLCVVYMICCRSEERMLAKAVRLNAILVSTCRLLDVFNGHHILPERLQDCAFTFWLAKEQLHRLAFSVLRIDSYLSILLDHPPSIRYQELCIPLLKSSQLWTASSEEERRSLQWDEPAGREKALFSYLMRDVLSDGASPGLRVQRNLPYRLTGTDYHLCLCAMQVGIWEAAREAHSAASDDIVTKLTPGDPILVWRANLTLWQAKMEKECRLVDRLFSTSPEVMNPTNSDDVLAPLTIVLGHISSLKMHAPLTLLRIHGNLTGHTGLNAAAAAAMAAVQKPNARMRAWASSQCPRTAVWNASQIARVVAQGLPDTITGSNSDGGASRIPTRLLLNPLAIPGLLMSAIVTCSYVSHTSACLTCSPNPAHGNGVDLFTAKEEDVGLARWREHGEGWAIWGPSGIILCRCHLESLAKWFSRALAMDQGAHREFEAYYKGL